MCLGHERSRDNSVTEHEHGHDRRSQREQWQAKPLPQNDRLRTGDFGIGALSSAPPSLSFYSDSEKSLVPRSLRGGLVPIEAPLCDQNGLPLVPQPSKFKDDPLVSAAVLIFLYMFLFDIAIRPSNSF